MKPLALSSVVLLLVFGGADGDQTSPREVGEVNITQAQPSYEDFSFQVGFEPVVLHHGRFEIYDIVIAIKHDKRKPLAPEGYIEFWDKKQFVASCSVPQTDEGTLRLTLKEKVASENAVFFSFRINPRYVEGSWFNYPVLRADGSVEMNCVVRLKDFVRVVPLNQEP